MLRNLTRSGALLLGAVILGSCDLEILHPSQPDAERVLAEPGDIESLLNYQIFHSSLYGSTGVFWGITAGQSFASYSSLANNCQNARNGIPRAINDNTVGNLCQGEQRRVYYMNNELVRLASIVLTRLDDPEFTLGTPARDLRARSFAQFLRGLSLGYLSMFYDSSAVVAPGMSSEDPGELMGYQEVHDAAMEAFAEAITHASNPVASQEGGFPIPTSWYPTAGSTSAANFIRIIRSYRARIEANVARTPTDPVDWGQVIADVTNGITADHMLITDPTVGITNNWVSQWYSYGTWHQMTPFVIGMADVSGSYAEWIALPLDSRPAGGTFHLVTPDLRFPQGVSRAEQQADFSVADAECSTSGGTCKRYFRNRPDGNDQFIGLGWGWSEYDHARHYSWRFFGDAGSPARGAFPFITKAEMDLLAAEGHIRGPSPNLDAAATLINVTREGNGGLPPVSGGDAQVPGGSIDCVPKVPQPPPNHNTIACGSLLEAMKYEKRIETAITTFSAWWLDMRRWGDMPEGTGLYFAVPFTDLQARGYATSELYSTGLNTTPGSWAGQGTYGW